MSITNVLGMNNLFRIGRHMMKAKNYRTLRDRSLVEWEFSKLTVPREVVGADEIVANVLQFPLDDRSRRAHGK